MLARGSLREFSIFSGVNFVVSPALENIRTLKLNFVNFPKMLRYVVFLENCWNNMLMTHGSPIYRTKPLMNWNFMHPGSQSVTFMNISSFL